MFGGHICSNSYRNFDYWKSIISATYGQMGIPVYLRRSLREYSYNIKRKGGLGFLWYLVEKLVGAQFTTPF